MLLRSRHGPWVRLIFMIGAVSLFMIGYYWGNQYKFRHEGPPMIEGVLVRPPIELPAVELQDVDGRRFTVQQFADHWTLLAFGELSHAGAHLAISRMIDVFNRLADRPELRAQMQLVLVADNPPLGLARDFSRLSPALRVLSGEAGDLQRLRAALGGESDEDASFYLVDPHGHLRAFFPSTQGPAAIAADIAALAERPEELGADTPK